MRYPFDATGTIGKLKCEQALGQILAERNDKVLINKIVHLLQMTKLSLKELDNLKTQQVYFAKLLRQDVESRLSKIVNMPVRGVAITDSIVSHTMCCIHAYFGNALERWKSSK